jgi:O-antigen/teichoic acid export membrane protein
MMENTPLSQKKITKEALRGTFWNYLSFASGKLLNFVATIILARLLVPEQFGLVAYCTIAIQYLDILNTAGINSALIARKDKLEEAANSAFIANIALGIVSFAITWFAAPQIAAFFKADEVTELIRLLAFVLPINGLGEVPRAMIMRSLRFKTKLIPDLARNLTKGLVSVILALLGYGPWSLIWGQVIGDLVGVTILWGLVNWRPSWKFEPQTAKEVLIFGGHIVLVEIAGQIRNNVDYLIVGKVLGASLLGAYTLAYRIPELAIRSFDRVISGVSFPLLARVQSDKAFLKSTYFGYIRYISLFTFSVGFGIAIISRLFVETFLSSKWSDTILPMSLIAVALAIISVGHIPGIFYKAIGRPEILNRLSIIKIPVIVGIVLFSTRWGIVGVAVGQVIFAVISVLFDSYVVSRIIGFRIYETVKSLFPAVFCSLSMLVTTTLVKILFAPEGIIGLIVILLTGVTTFMLTLSIVDPSLIQQTMSRLLKRRLIRGEAK